MAITPDTSRRQVVPRFRSSATARMSGELEPATRQEARPVSPQSVHLNEKLVRWSESGALDHAIEVVEAATVVGATSAAAAAAAAVAADRRATDAARRLAQALLVESPNDWQTRLTDGQRDDLQLSISRLRERTRQYPGNPLAWHDLSLAHADAGNNESAIRAMNVALQLQPDFRFLLRSASRLFMHAGQEDRALWVLRRSEVSRHDPWVVAAEIAVSSATGSSSQFMSTGRRMAKSDRLSMLSTSELRGALGMQALEAGDTKTTKRMFRSALIEPTANVVAQAEWLTKEGCRVEVEREMLCISHEALALERFVAQDWNSALDQSVHWHTDEPFAPQPALFAAYVACVLDDRYRDAIAMLERVRRGAAQSVDGWLVSNDLAVSRAMTDDLPGAVDALAEARVDSSDPVQSGIISATSGLLAFRSGDVEEGRRQYALAVETLRNAPVEHSSLRAGAAVWWAREEARLGQPLAPQVLDRAEALMRATPRADLSAIFQRALDAWNGRRAD